MDKREYLKSLGFEVGDRGRFSAEMKTALKDYESEGGQLQGRVGKRDDGLPVIEPGVVVPDIAVSRPAVREAKTLKGKTTEGYVVGFVICSECHYHMIYCDCEGGVKAPPIVVSSKDPLVRV